jgi:hypothetical protein
VTIQPPESARAENRWRAPSVEDRLLGRSDKALLAAFLLAAALGTWTRCLMHADGAVIVSAGWFGSLWDLYISQIESRAVAVFAMHGPAWLARAAFNLDANAYLTLAHLLYFAVPLVLWLMLRAVERDRLFSRLYLALALAMIYFPAELIFGIGLWLIWLAMVSDPVRSTAGVVLATLLLGAVMAFTHPALALMGLFFVAAGLALPLFGQRLPTRSLVAVAALSVALLAFYLAAARWLPPTNPTDGASQVANRFAYINPVWMLKTLMHFPMLAVLWFLLLVPDADTLRLRWRSLPLAILAIAAFGLWCAAAGTSLNTSTLARHTGLYAMTLALVLALPAPAEWLRRAERPLILFAAIVAVSAVSFNVDLWLFDRFIDRELRPGIVDAATLPAPWPSKRPEPPAVRILFKFGVGEEYVRDSVMPSYDWFRIPLAFHTYFRSDRQGALFHPVGDGAEWRPFECPAVERALSHARDAQDRQFLEFLAAHYCVGPLAGNIDAASKQSNADSSGR